MKQSTLNFGQKKTIINPITQQNTANDPATSTSSNSQSTSSTPSNPSLPSSTSNHALLANGASNPSLTANMSAQTNEETAPSSSTHAPNHQSTADPANEHLAIPSTSIHPTIQNKDKQQEMSQVKPNIGKKAAVQGKLNFTKSNPSSQPSTLASSSSSPSNLSSSLPSTNQNPSISTSNTSAMTSSISVPDPPASSSTQQESQAPSSKRPRRSKEATSRHIPSGQVDISKVDLDQYEIKDDDDEHQDGNGSSRVGGVKAGSIRGKYNTKAIKAAKEAASSSSSKGQSDQLEGKKKRKLAVGESGNPPTSLALERSDSKASSSGGSRENAIFLDDDDDDEVDAKGKKEVDRVGGNSKQKVNPPSIPIQQDGNSSDDGIEFVSSTLKPSTNTNTNTSTQNNPTNSNSNSNSKPSIVQTGFQVKGNLGQGKVAHSFFQKRTKNSSSNKVMAVVPSEVVDLISSDDRIESGSTLQSSSTSNIDASTSTSGSKKIAGSSNGFFSSSSSSSKKKAIENKGKKLAPWPSRDSVHVQPPSNDGFSQISRPSSTSSKLSSYFWSDSSHVDTLFYGFGKGKSKALEPDSEEGRKTLANLIGLDSSSSLEKLLSGTQVDSSLQPIPRRGGIQEVVKKFIEKEIDYDFGPIAGNGNIVKNDPLVKTSSHASISNLLVKCLSSDSQSRPHLDRSRPPNYEISSKPSSELWTEKYRPRSWDQVLGNEGNSRYLKEWLTELMVDKKVVKAIQNANEIIGEKDQSNRNKMKVSTHSQSESKAKKRKVQKGLETKRGGKRLKYGSEDEDSLEDWIADDDEEEDEIAVEDSALDGDDDALMFGLEKQKEKEEERKKRKKNKFVINSSDNEEDGIDGGEETETELSGTDSLKKAINGISRPGNANKDHSDLTSREQTPATEINSLPPSQEQQNPSTSNPSSTSNHSSSTSNHDGSISSSSTPKAPIYAQSTCLTNLIILAGPIGSGKTASVFAVAEELGYNVFELNPGSKRGTKELLQEVGEVGRNHQVSGGGNRFIPNSSTKEKKSNAFDQLFKAAKKLKEEEKREEKKENANGTQIGSGTSSKMRQSLILIEEADIVYEQDVGFWKGLETFLKTCSRPVIVTCNGEFVERSRSHSSSISGFPIADQVSVCPPISASLFLPFGRLGFHSHLESSNSRNSSLQISSSIDLSSLSSITSSLRRSSTFINRDQTSLRFD